MSHVGVPNVLNIANVSYNATVQSLGVPHIFFMNLYAISFQII